MERNLYVFNHKKTRYIYKYECSWRKESERNRERKIKREWEIKKEREWERKKEREREKHYLFECY